MRAPRGWFEWVRLVGRIIVGTMMLGFIVHWIWGFDGCLRESLAQTPQPGCLMSSFADVYVAWWVRGAA